MGRLRVTPGFLLLLAALFYLDEGAGMLGWGLLACSAHEMGHYLAGRLLGGRLEWLELSGVGAQMSMKYRMPLSYGRETAVALAGPVVNLLMGWACARAKLYLLAGLSFGLGGFNLLPVLPLDGGRALYCGICMLFGVERGEQVMAVAAGIMIGVMAGAGALLAAQYSNFTLLITSVWLLWAALGREKRKGKNVLLF